MVFVTFDKIQNARTGNILFQYLAAKVISLKWGHTYVPIEEFIHTDNIVHVNDTSYADIIHGVLSIQDKHVICSGFFQNDDYFLLHRLTLLYEWSHCDDYWIGTNGRKQYIRDFYESKHSIEDLSDRDVVLSLRLDDFIQLPCSTSDIIPPDYYMDILENLPNIHRLFIVCDTIRHDWEHKYLGFFQKWNPILLQKDIMHDCALIRDAHVLLHSNSTLCWFMSFLSLPQKTRYIPKTNFYSGQNLNAVEPGDVITHVSPLSHHAVYHLDYSNYIMKHIYPLPYCIPDECIVDFEQATRNKTVEIASLTPGDKYVYGPDDEDDYHRMYQNAFFSVTMKKGGWDCLRHYEILANGCIPLFRDLESCPSSTLYSFPKELLREANQQLIPWSFDKKPLYDSYMKRLLEHTKNHCSTSATVKYFFRMLPRKVETKTRNVLLITGHRGVNYTRETFWIGMKRYIQSLKGIAVEYPKIDFLYNNYKGEKKSLYGNGFTYAYRLEDDYDFSKDEIEEKVSNHFFDLIVYGKVGPDEFSEGSLPHIPLWDRVYKNYHKNEIVFLYGGDECNDLTHPNRYREHIMHHSQFAHCFVRELRL